MRSIDIGLNGIKRIMDGSYQIQLIQKHQDHIKNAPYRIVEINQKNFINKTEGLPPQREKP